MGLFLAADGNILDIVACCGDGLCIADQKMIRFFMCMHNTKILIKTVDGLFFANNNTDRLVG